MKKLTGVLLSLALTSVIALTTARGQPANLWTVDENGPAVLGPGTMVGYANGAYKLDPLSGMVGWYYPLGASIPGDVPIYEPGSSIMSDLLRFDGGGVFFFSQLEPGDANPSSADVPQLPSTLVNVGLLEGPNGAFYNPRPGMTGYDLSGVLPGLEYNFISDVPEPGSAALLSGAAAMLGCYFIRRKARA